MMKIRLTGTLEELEQAVEKMKTAFEVVGISKPYANRNSAEYRIYVEVKLT